MKQKFIEKLQIARLEKYESWPTELATIEYIEGESHLHPDNLMRLDLVARFNSSFIVEKGEEYQLEAAKQYLARAIDDYMYGDIKNELIEAIMILRSEMQIFDSKGIKKLDDLLDSLNS